MFTEDYVSFKTAKLLKEKGFDWYTYAYYEDEDNPNISLHASKAINWNKTEFISKPTLQMAMKWLREEKGIAIIPILSSVLDFEKFLWDIKIVVAKTNETYSQGWIYEKYEKVCEAAVKYCLENLI